MDDRSLWNAGTADGKPRDTITVSARDAGRAGQQQQRQPQQRPRAGTNPAIPPASLGWAALTWRAVWNWVLYGDTSGPQPPPEDPMDPPSTAIPAPAIVPATRPASNPPAKPSTRFGSDHVLG